MLVSDTSKEQKFEIPAAGKHDAVLADTIDLGIQETPFGKQQQIKLVWLLATLDSKGRMMRASCPYHATLHPDSNLYAAILNIRGDIPSLPFDLDTMIGRCNQLELVPTTSASGRVYAKVLAILPATKTVTIPTKFKRQQDLLQFKKKGQSTAPDFLKQLQARRASAAAPVSQDNCEL